MFTEVHFFFSPPDYLDNFLWLVLGGTVRVYWLTAFPGYLYICCSHKSSPVGLPGPYVVLGIYQVKIGWEGAWSGGTLETASLCQKGGKAYSKDNWSQGPLGTESKGGRVTEKGLPKSWNWQTL